LKVFRIWGWNGKKEPRIWKRPASWRNDAVSAIEYVSRGAVTPWIENKMEMP